MTGQDINNIAKIDNFVEQLKSRIPEADHPALESRRQALANDSDADADDVISILRQEFTPLANDSGEEA
jgi:hypothetical protein